LLYRAAMRFLKQTRSRGTRLVWIRCACGESFRHTASRPLVACYRCGRTARLRRLEAGNSQAAARPAKAARRRSRA
jgi:hypothetical protein